MDKEKIFKAYLPMTETMYYILLSLNEKRHGYGVMLHVEELTKKRIKLGAGTIYNSLSKLERDGLIVPCEEIDRKKLYKITQEGIELLKLEVERLGELWSNGNLANL